MTIDLWVREVDAQLLRRVHDIEVHPYLDGIFQGQLDNEGILGAIDKKFVLGKHGVFVPKETKEVNSFAYIKHNSAYPQGLILTPFSGIDIRYHRKSRGMKQAGIHTQELIGNHDENFIARAFRTYYDSLINKFSDRDHHLLLYSSGRRRDILKQ